MLRRVSIVLAGLFAAGLVAAAPAAAQPGDVHGCWYENAHVTAGSVHVAYVDHSCWHVG
ncbi:hypothetical protein [Streptomyces sp. KLOTTS4A1]|uniref:hypothetical protein n=1 Tax=Streptomyces sp. KLOTTS4A1 TaxID=3390996 RepID=UPI0039F571B8